MKVLSETVALGRCQHYDRNALKERIAEILPAAGFTVAAGSKMLLKPNLVTARLHDGLACTHPEFVAAVAEFFLDHGASVSVGDSPAFGSARGVMSACGISEALKRLPVKLVDLKTPQQVRLAGGFTVGIAKEAFDCDVLINLPKVKAHNQLLVSLAVKNYFGTVVGFRKPFIHACHGDIENRFEALLVDLLLVLPDSFTLADGVVAMHCAGPVKGKPYRLGVVAGSENPVALDTALLRVLGVDPARSLLWRECDLRDLPGVRAEEINYPLLEPAELAVADFIVPEKPTPLSFNPWRLVTGGVKRLMANISQG